MQTISPVILPTGIRFVEGQGGLTAVEVSTPAATALVYLHGAHVAEWTPAGEKPVLWMSRFGKFSATDALRGGIPLCFPWFGPNRADSTAPNHGWARISEWELAAATRVDDTATLSFTLSNDSDGVPDGIARFFLRLTVTVGAALELELAVRNDAAEPLEFEEAFHTYLAVGDISESRVTGFEALPYVDRTVSPEVTSHSELPVTFTGTEIDRIYPMPASVTISDNGNQRSILVEAIGAADSVVWNPGSAKAAAMADYGTDEWTETACVEACNIRDNAITVLPGDTHRLRVRFAAASATTDNQTSDDATGARKRTTMDRLTKNSIAPTKELVTKAIQFGEGNFLRAFIDWQLQQMNNQGLFNGGVKIVQPIEGGRVADLDEQDGLYTVLLEGLEDGKDVETSEVITLINGTVNPYVDNQEYLDLAEDDNIEFIFSNTTESGIVFDAADTLEDAPQHSFPGKLTALLYKRFTLGKRGFHIIPCELIEHNGDKLKETVLSTAENWTLGAGFTQWLHESNTFYSTLVDRIVPGYPRDRAEALAEEFGYDDHNIVKTEPFLLFVIEGPKALEEILPLKKAGLNVIVTDDMAPYRERKVFLLNGPHTTMASIARLAGIEAVREVMKDEDFGPFVDKVMYDEIIPVLNLPHDELAAYAESVKERFENRFIHHELKSIALNSISKFRSRLLPIVLGFYDINGTYPERITLALSALLLTYSGDPAVTVTPVDSEETLATFRAAYAAADSTADYACAILSDDTLWGTDLASRAGLVEQVTLGIENLRSKGARALVAELA